MWSDLGMDPGAGGARTVAEIEAGLAADEFRPWFQPIVELTTGQIIGVEALARWQRPGGMEVPPSFIPVAEQSDLVLEVDAAVLRHALGHLAQWQQTWPDFRLSANLSARNLDRFAVVAEIDAAVRAAGVEPTTIDLEITETTRPSGLETPRVVLAELRARGYAIWLDDFGSGWSALRDLISLPVDGIKLDWNFAQQLGTPVDDALIGALTAAGNQVGWRVTMEGVEQRWQLDRARALGCHLGQGHWWAQARPADEIPALVDGWEEAQRTR